MAADAPAMLIVTEHVYPPIPIRQFDWRATFKEWDLGDPMGEGPTEFAAIVDLLEQVEFPLHGSGGR
ncbi:MAG: hypothetical protein WDN25_13190 [Acetobacteraceae bacterium]